MEVDRIDEARGQVPEEAPRWFQGEARIQQLASPFGAEGGPAVFAVHFPAGVRTRPHVHAAGQLLHIVGGRGLVGTAEGRQEVSPGDVVATMPGEWHWHGAMPGSAMSHLTVQVAGDHIDWDVEEKDWADGYG